MHNNLEEKLSLIKEDMMYAVLDGDELRLAELQHRHNELESLILGDNTIA